MVPLPGEKGDDWTANTSYPGPPVAAGEGEDDKVAVFYHYVPAELEIQ